MPVAGGVPTPLLLNASGLIWIGHDRCLFAVKGGLHMAIVTADDACTDSRTCTYVPAHDSGMADPIVPLTGS